MICNTGASNAGWMANRLRSGFGNNNTHWRTGNFGMTWSARWAAASAMRRVPHEGQMPRTPVDAAMDRALVGLGNAALQRT